PDWLSDAIGPVRAAPGGRGNDAMMRAASATARCRGLADPVVRGPAVPVRAPDGCGPDGWGPDGWLPQPDRTTAAHATANTKPGRRGRSDGRGRGSGRHSDPQRIVMPLRRSLLPTGCKPRISVVDPGSAVD